MYGIPESLKAVTANLEKRLEEVNEMLYDLKGLLKRQTIKLLKLTLLITLVWSLSQGQGIRRTTRLESANLRPKSTQKENPQRY